MTLAEGAVYSNDPAKYKRDLQETAAATPASVAAAARKWMGRPAFRLTFSPGERSAEDIAAAGSVARPPPGLFPQPRAGRRTGAGHARRGPGAAAIAEPPVEPVRALGFPAVERARLSNGIEVIFARRAAVPVVDVAVAFDAGNAADDRAKLGTEALLLALLKEGTAGSIDRRSPRSRSGSAPPSRPMRRWTAPPSRCPR